ncbi:TonB-dependent receptor family protein [Pseudolysobacter antarcticus]|nr:TonB-dependent receptor [Pseudolysobacter antarcticus]
MSINLQNSFMPGFRHSALSVGILLAFANAGAWAETPLGTDMAAADNTTRLNEVQVKDKPWMWNIETKRAHLLPEVDGTKITVTKKSTVEKLDDIPTVIDNNLRNLFAHIPGILVSEQQTPGQLNVNYRGIGNPQEGEYILSLQDGIPIVSDWIGFPTNYYIPVPQSIESIQFLRAGSGLLYGPEPAVLNYVTRRPDPSREFGGYTENVIGSHGLFSDYTEVDGTSGQWEYRADFNYRQADGQRDNGDYKVSGGDLHLGYKLDDTQKLTFDLHAYRSDNAQAGRMSYTQWIANPNLTTTPDNRTWVDHDFAVLGYENHFNDKTQLEVKLWRGYHDQADRSESLTAKPVPNSTLESQKYRFTGLDARLRHDWGQGNAFTTGFTAYQSDSPWRKWLGTNLVVDQYDHSGTPTLRQDRSTDYAAVFAENVFRFGKFHIVPSVRFEHEKLDVDETLNTGKTGANPPVPLIDKNYAKSVPLFGLGLGNDFGHGNETYVNVSQGFRPLRYLDIGSPFGKTSPSNNDPDPTKSTTYEAGIHGWPAKGLYYDVSLFEIDFKNRLESQVIDAIGDTINVNTGDTRHRGIEGQIEYDLLAIGDRSNDGQHLNLFANASFLNAKFTGSTLKNPNGTSLVGNTPAFAPHYVARAGVVWAQDKHYKLSLSASSVASQYWQDNDTGTTAVLGQPGYLPAKIPQYTVVDFSGDYNLTERVRLLAGISNLGDKVYYSRVFQNGLEPAFGRTYYAGISLGF